MSVALSDRDRRIVPRWRRWKLTTSTGELATSSRERPPLSLASGDAFQEKLLSWREEHSIGAAADLVGSALVLGRGEEVAEAADYLLAPSTFATTLVKRVAAQVRAGGRTVVRPSEQSKLVGTRIHSLRKRLRQDPRNAIAWVDISREYAVSGRLEAAKRAMTVAVSLVKGNRFVLRSAARLFVHADVPDIAHDILLSRESTTRDPWLAAAEIAVASVAGRKSRLAKRASNWIEHDAYSLFEASELASALGTLELHHGNVKRARKLFIRSLLNPTDNALAQAGWASKHISGLELQAHMLSVPRSFEAQSRIYYEDREFQPALEQCEQWLDDEPYSSRPAMFGSYLAALALDDYEASARFAERGLVANPGDPGLMNNLVVALVHLGKLDDAIAKFARIGRPGPDARLERTFIATEGLIRFRQGNFVEGRRLYAEAIRQASEGGARRQARLAAVHLAEEEWLATRYAMSDETIKVFEGLRQNAPPEVTAFIERIVKRVEAREG